MENANTGCSFFLSVFWIAVISASCAMPSSNHPIIGRPAETRATNSIGKKEFSRLMATVEDWHSSSEGFLGPSRYTHWTQLISVAKVLQTNDPPSVERALAEYQEHGGSDAKLFLLMRVIFDLPENAPRHQIENAGGWRPTFGFWMTGGTEYNADGTINVAWPIKWNHGQPTVFGVSFYEGPRYNATAEYAYFLHRYPLRDLTGDK